MVFLLPQKSPPFIFFCHLLWSCYQKDKSNQHYKYHIQYFGQYTVHTLWQYQLWSFKFGDTKLEKKLPTNQHTRRKLLNFENWFSGELSELSIIFVIKFSKNVNDKKCGPKLVIGLWRSILALFDTSALHRCSKIKISLWVCWILGTNLETPYTSIATRVSSFYMTQVS